jgi:hypothetical protein
MAIKSFPYKHTGKPRIVSLIDDTIVVALQFTEKSPASGRILKRYKTAFYSIKNNPYLQRVLTTNNILGQNEVLENFISQENFDKAKTFIQKRL